MKIKFKYLPAASLLLAANASAGTLSVPVSQDGWLGPEGPSNPGATIVQDGGVGPQLNIATPGPSSASQYTRKAWFGFDLAALKAAVGNSYICSASITFQLSTNVNSAYNGNNSIRFYGVASVNPGSIDDTATSAVFDETTLTWDNAPGNIDGDVLAGDKVNGAILGDVAVPNPAASGAMVLSGFDLASFIQSCIEGTNSWASVAATYLGQNNNGYGPGANGFPTGLSFVSKEGGVGKATLNVDYQPTPCPMVIVTEPQSGCYYPGSALNLSVRATGTAPILYQWTKNGVNVPGGTGATLTLANLQPSDAGVYAVALANSVGTTNSTPATIDVVSPPAISGGLEEAVGKALPLGYWRFNETTPILQDPGTNQGTVGVLGDSLYQNLPEHQRPGALVGDTDKATHFSSAQKQALLVPYMPDWNPAPPFSIECWVKADTISGTGCPFGSLQRSGSSAAGWLIYQAATGWNFRMGNTTNNYSVNLTGGGAPDTNKWYHLVGTYDGATAFFYVNGVQVGTTSTADYEPNPIVGLGIGGRGDAAFYFDGAVDEAAIYTNVLSSTEVLNHYSNGTSPSPSQSYSSLVLAGNPVGYWRLGEPNVKVVASNRGSRCAVADAVYIPANTSVGVIGIADGIAGPQPPSALGLEAGNKAVEFTGSWAAVPALGLNKNTATITAWVKRNGPQQSWAGIFFSRDAGTTAGLHFGDSNGTTPDDLRYTWAGGQYGWSSGLVPPDGVWTFVALVVEPSKATMYMYDGQALRSAVNSANHAAQSFGGISYVGVDPNNFTARTYNGALDEVAFFGTALTPTQIAGIVAASKYGNTPPSIASQPAPQSVLAGDAVTLTVTSAGSLPLSYQWNLNGVAIPGATGSSYVIPGAYYTDAGSYSVTVTNKNGTATSVAATIAVAASDPMFANLTNGLVLHMAFDGDYQDSSGRGNHGTPVGTPVIEAGKIGSGALRYIVEKDSSGITNNSFVTLGSPSDLQFGTANFSVAYWIKFLSPTVDLPVFCNDDCGEGCIGFYFGPSVYADGRWAWALADSSYAGPSAEGTNVISDGTWHHIVNTFDRSGDAVTYQDGVLVDRRPITTFTASLDTGNPVNIGQVGTADYAVNYTAVVDDLGVWLRSLNQAEAESIYRVGQNHGKSFDTYGPVKLSISSTSTGVELIWQSGTLLSSDSLTGLWTAVTGAKAPYYKVTPGTGNRFYRVQL